MGRRPITCDVITSFCVDITSAIRREVAAGPPFRTCDGTSLARAKKNFGARTLRGSLFTSVTTAPLRATEHTRKEKGCSSDAYDVDSFLCSECADGYTLLFRRCDALLPILPNSGEVRVRQRGAACPGGGDVRWRGSRKKQCMTKLHPFRCVFLFQKKAH